MFRMEHWIDWYFIKLYQTEYFIVDGSNLHMFHINRPVNKEFISWPSSLQYCAWQVLHAHNALRHLWWFVKYLIEKKSIKLWYARLFHNFSNLLKLNAVIQSIGQKTSWYGYRTLSSWLSKSIYNTATGWAVGRLELHEYLNPPS